MQQNQYGDTFDMYVACCDMKQIDERLQSPSSDSSERSAACRANALLSKPLRSLADSTTELQAQTLVDQAQAG